jgi:two-component system response regulator FixJ
LSLAENNLIYIVDDDQGVRLSLAMLLRAHGFETHSFGAGVDFFDSFTALQPAPVLLDLHMPAMDGIEFLLALRERTQIGWPVVMMSGNGDVSSAVLSMKLGAVDFIEKPIQPETLFSVISAAQSRQAAMQGKAEGQPVENEVRERLSPREFDVLQMIAHGMATKSIAAHLGISPRTVEMHRAHIVRRLQVRSMSEAVALAARAERD